VKETTKGIRNPQEVNKAGKIRRMGGKKTKNQERCKIGSQPI